MSNPYIIYDEIFIPDYISQHSVRSIMQICPIEKVTISYSHNSLVQSPTDISIPISAITYLTGQRCAVISARKSVSTWKLRKKAIIGCKVTLRRQKSFFFILKLYIYGLFISPVQNKFLKKNFCFGITKLQKKDCFFELQKYGINWKNFEGFSISIS